jgi:chromosome segregation ATPase
LTDQETAAEAQPTEEVWDGTGSVFGNDTSEGSSGDPLPGVDMVMDDDGQLVFGQQETAEEPSAPEPVAPAEPTSSEATEYKARLEGLQAKLTPTFQENAELKRQLAAVTATVNELKAAQTTATAQASDGELDAQIQAGIEKWQETGLTEDLAATIKHASKTLSSRDLEEKLAPVREQVAYQNHMVRAQKEAYDVIGEWGNKVNALAPVVQQIAEKRPDIMAKYELRQVYRIADNWVQREMQRQGVPATPQAQQQEQAGNPSAAAANSPTTHSANDLASRARALNTEEGGSPPNAVRGNEASEAPSNLDDAVEQAWSQTMTR